MTANEIAETLLNGNIAQARQEILETFGAYNVAVLTLDVVAELADLLAQTHDFDESATLALGRVRRCLEGAP